MLRELIDRCIAKKEGNKEFALFFWGEGWKAEIGNQSESVSLGESSGEFSAEGTTPEEAVEGLLKELEDQSRQDPLTITLLKG